MCCDPSNCCKDNECCGPGDKCCTDAPWGYCCDDEETCCGGFCCDDDQTCGGGNECCEVWDECCDGDCCRALEYECCQDFGMFKMCVDECNPDGGSPCDYEDLSSDCSISQIDGSCIFPDEQTCGLAPNPDVDLPHDAMCATCEPDCNLVEGEYCAMLWPSVCKNRWLTHPVCECCPAGGLVTPMPSGHRIVCGD